MDFSKLIYQTLEEALGVPDNITEESKRVYKKIVSFLKEHADFEGMSFKDINLKIGNEIFKHLHVEFVIVESSDVRKPFLSRFSATAKVFFDSRKLKLRRQFDDTFLLKITAFMPENFKKEQLISLFEQDEYEIISTIAHELHHAFQFRMQNQFSYVSQINYLTSASNFETKIPTIDKFLYFCYFVDDFETNTRASQIIAYASLNQIRKKDFASFLQNNSVYVVLKEIQKFSYEHFLSSLTTDLQKIGKDSGSKETVSAKTIEEVLNHTFKALQHIKSVQFRQTLGDLSEVNKEDFEKFVQIFIKNLKKFQRNPSLFFQKKCAQNSEKASKAIKKISKIYDLLQENDEMCTIGALDWDNYQFFKEPKKVVIEDIDETFAVWLEGLFARKEETF